MEPIFIGALIGFVAGIGLAALAAASDRNGIWPEAAAIIILGCCVLGALGGILEYLL